MKVAKNLVSTIEIEIEIIEIHDILKLKLKYSKQSKLKSNWPHISVIEIEIEIHFKIEITLRGRTLEHVVSCLHAWETRRNLYAKVKKPGFSTISDLLEHVNMS